MKNTYIVFLICVALNCMVLHAQKKTAKKTAPEQYFSESGIPLRLVEVKDKNGKIQEKIFYRDQGKVKSDTINEKQVYKNGKISEDLFYTGDGKLSFGTKFNEAGKEIETTFYEKNGEIHSRTAYSYAADGSVRSDDYSKDGKLKSSTTQDAEGRALQDINYKPDGTISFRRVYKSGVKTGGFGKSETMDYDGANTLIRKEVLDHQTNRQETTEYYKSGKIKSFEIEENAHSRNSRKTEMDAYEEDGSCRKSVMKYFKSKEWGGWVGQAVEMNCFKPDGKLKEKYVFKYDNEGNEVERIVTDADGKQTSSYVTTYDEKGKKLEETGYDAAGKIFFKDSYSYDNKGNLKDVIRTLSDGTTKQLAKNGKWLK